MAVLFGQGDGITTCPCDAANDGVTNPSPINGNSRSRLSVAPGTAIDFSLLAKNFNKSGDELP